MTFKQLEAIYWVVELGGFAHAARRLRTTQSAVSKRVKELEALYGTPLFDRALRTARLTEKGEEMFVVARRLVEQRDAAVAQFVRPEIAERRIRMGVTELTAMTWLPRLVKLLRDRHPGVVLEPEVENSVTLRDQLLGDELDLIVVPDAFDDARFSSAPMGSVEQALMCRPGLVRARKGLRIHDLVKYRLLIQGRKSGTGIIYESWFDTIGVNASETLVTPNLVAHIGITVSGLAIGYLPRRCLDPMIKAGKLQLVKALPEPPDVAYVSMCRRDHRSALLSSVIGVAQESCDFSSMYQAD